MAFLPAPPEEIFTIGMSLPSWVLPMLETVTLLGWAAAISLTNAEIFYEQVFRVSSRHHHRSLFVIIYVQH